MQYDVEVSEPAELEIDGAYHHLLLRSPQAAAHLRDGLGRAIASLSQMPLRCPLAPENGMLDRPVRQLLHRFGGTAYRILFITIAATEDAPGLVRVIRVRHGAQRYLGLSVDEAGEE